jgi:sugar/nucleoside kinase (ribokinase family)
MASVRMRPRRLVFLARLSLGDDPAQAAWVANVAASLTVERPGPATGPTATELQTALEQD